MHKDKSFRTFIVLFFFIFNAYFCLAQSPSQERENLERQLTEIETQIDKYEGTISSYQKQGKSLKGEISKLENNISKLNLQIKAINLELVKLDLEIFNNKKQISATQKDLDFNKIALASALQNLYETDKVDVVNLLLANNNFSNFFGSVQGLINVQNSLQKVIKKISDLREKLFNQKEDLALQKSDKKSLIDARDRQKKTLEVSKVDKADILKKTKGEETVFQQLLQETKKTAAQIRNKIFQLLGGGELTFGDAYKLAQIAEKAVGVRAAFILAVLDRESALGQNVGRCGYEQAMNPRRDIPIFLNLLAELNINASSVTVSCANRDGAYGGAMGPAQFIPSTWVLYKERVSELTGNRPPSPWRNVDAFMATALYLKDKGADFSGEAVGVSERINREREAAARYYAGSRWRRYLWTYGERVIAKARQFEEDILDLLPNNI